MKTKSRNMIDDEEMEEESEEELEDEDDDLIVNQKGKVPAVAKKTIPVPKPIEESQSAQEEKPKVQIVEREITLSLLNDKLNYIISVLQK